MGQYNNGIPEDSRYAVHKDEFGSWAQHLHSEEGQKEIAKVKELTKIAEQGRWRREHAPVSTWPVINSGFTDLKCSVAQLALAWVAKVHPYTSTVILGATKPEQLIENLGAIKVLSKLTPEVMERIEKVLGNKPAPIVSHPPINAWPCTSSPRTFTEGEMPPGC